LDLDHQVGPEAGIEEEVGALQAVLARDRPPRLVDRHARHPDRPDVRLERGLVVIRAVSHDTRPATRCACAAPRRMAPAYWPSPLKTGKTPPPFFRRGGRMASAYSQSCSGVSNTFSKIQSSSYSHSSVLYSRQILGRLR